MAKTPTRSAPSLGPGLNEAVTSVPFRVTCSVSGNTVSPLSENLSAIGAGVRTTLPDTVRFMKPRKPSSAYRTDGASGPGPAAIDVMALA
jgi:hypothetical protein